MRWRDVDGLTGVVFEQGGLYDYPLNALNADVAADFNGLCGLAVQPIAYLFQRRHVAFHAAGYGSIGHPVQPTNGLGLTCLIDKGINAADCFLQRGLPYFIAVFRALWPWHILSLKLLV